MLKNKRRIPLIDKCFDHLGGKLAPILFECLVEKEWIKPKAGTKTVFEVTERGKTQRGL